MTQEHPPDIIFVVIDTCRADLFYDLLDDGKLPNLNKVFVKSTDYRRAISAAPWTVPAHGSLFTGLYPTDHRTSAADPNFKPPNKPLAEQLQNRGYWTAGISANPWISPSYGFDQGFNQFKTAYDLFWGGAAKADLGGLSTRTSQLRTLLGRMSLKSSAKTLGNIVYEKTLAKRSDSGAKRTTTEAIGLLKKQLNRPKFIFLNYMEPHLEYSPPEKFALDELPSGIDMDEAMDVNQDPWLYIAGEIEMSEKDFSILRALYRAEIRYLDSQIGRLVSYLESTGKFCDTCLVIAGDHGEHIGEHGLMDHQYSLSQELVHVPLSVRYPSMAEGSQVKSLVETRRICPTLCQVAGLDPNTPELEPLLNDEHESVAIAEYPEPQPTLESLKERTGGSADSIKKYDRSLHSIQIGDWKYVEGSDGDSNLYNLAVDPTENNRVQNQLMANKLRERLHEERGELSERGSRQSGIDTQTVDRLKDLGYI